MNAASATIFYIYPDQLNTPRAITNEAATTIWKWDNNDPFGANIPNEDPDGDSNKFTFNLRFPGQYFDRETNTHYNYFRDYDSGQGRYTKSDPIGLNGGVNTYRYVDADPLSKTDPRGLEPPGSNADCFRRGDCQCVTPECSAGLSGQTNQYSCIVMCMAGVKFPVATANTKIGNWLGKSKRLPTLGPVARACMSSPYAAIFGVTFGLKECAEGCNFKAENDQLTLPALGN